MTKKYMTILGILTVAEAMGMVIIGTLLMCSILTTALAMSSVLIVTGVFCIVYVYFTWKIYKNDDVDEIDSW